MIITIDGPAGTGKSTIAKLLAEELNFEYFDTGAMYRAITWFILERNVDLSDDDALKNILTEFDFSIESDVNQQKQYFVGKKEITKEIREPRIGDFVSKVSAKKIVREFFLPWQRDYVKNKNIVCEGRDMGSVVFPFAEKKFFLTASAKIRAERRYDELVEKFPEKADSLNFENILEKINERDKTDSTRSISPLKRPKGAFVINTSNLSIEKVLEDIEKKLFSKPKLFYRFVISTLHYICKLFYRYEVYGFENIKKGAAVLASNHASYLDSIIVAVSAAPVEVHFLAKKELFKPKWFKKIIEALNTHPVTGEGSNAQTFKQILKLFREGKKVALFPEGLRTLDGNLTKVRPGTGFLAYEAKCDIIPIYLSGTFDAWKAEKKFPKLSGKIKCIFGTPIDKNEFIDLDKKKAILYISNAISEKWIELEKWCKDGCKGEIP